MIYHLLLSFYVACASNVLLLDPSGEFFVKEDRTEKSVSQIADLVSRSFYIGALDEKTDVSSLKFPQKSPTENVQITLFGVNPASLACIQKGFTSNVVPLTIGHGAGFAASNLVNRLYKAYPSAKVTSVSASKRIAELYNVQHRANVFTVESAVFNEDMENEGWHNSLNEIDLSTPELSSFMKEMELFLWATSKFGSGSEEEPAFTYLTLNTFSALPKDLRKGTALGVLNHVMSIILRALPEEGIAQVIFSDTRNILTNLYLDHAIPRRRLATSNSSSNVTYEELYEQQFFYWFLVGAALVTYFFVYCFAFMNYSNDQMLYTSFDASYKKDI
jgi:hypothetical protein